ncbi:unnamed protein product [Phytophthora fragariaefolia]|uniref:Unnamed protein product n=1 Tax=Phytophthora fragariaefolia TaxID=1490495 RepID=A0A9W7D5W8_9STRA|nr:unnamed protein product [Phytophthora fragariaefolia]
MLHPIRTDNKSPDKTIDPRSSSGGTVFDVDAGMFVSGGCRCEASTTNEILLRGIPELTDMLCRKEYRSAM